MLVSQLIKFIVNYINLEALNFTPTLHLQYSLSSDRKKISIFITMSENL